MNGTVSLASAQEAFAAIRQRADEGGNSAFFDLLLAELDHSSTCWDRLSADEQTLLIQSKNELARYIERQRALRCASG